jgi:hypothetical protein
MKNTSSRRILVSSMDYADSRYNLMDGCQSFHRTQESIDKIVSDQFEILDRFYLGYLQENSMSIEKANYYDPEFHKYIMNFDRYKELDMTIVIEDFPIDTLNITRLLANSLLLRTTVIITDQLWTKKVAKSFDHVFIFKNALPDFAQDSFDKVYSGTSDILRSILTNITTPHSCLALNMRRKKVHNTMASWIKCYHADFPSSKQ